MELLTFLVLHYCKLVLLLRVYVSVCECVCSSQSRDCQNSCQSVRQKAQPHDVNDTLVKMWSQTANSFLLKGQSCHSREQEAQEREVRDTHTHLMHFLTSHPDLKYFSITYTDSIFPLNSDLTLTLMPNFFLKFQMTSSFSGHLHSVPTAVVFVQIPMYPQVPYG